jgi:hypothetical protein
MLKLQTGKRRKKTLVMRMQGRFEWREPKGGVKLSEKEMRAES